MYSAETIAWARYVLQTHKITEDDVFNQDKEARLERYMIILTEECGCREEAERVRRALEVCGKHPSKTMITWAEEILEWDGLGLERGGDLKPGGYVEWYRDKYLQDYTSEERKYFFIATRVAHAIRTDKWAMMAAKVRHAAKAHQRESSRKKYVATQMKLEVKSIAWDNIPTPLWNAPWGVDDKCGYANFGEY